MEKVEKELTLAPSSIHPSLYNVVWRGGPGKVPQVLQGAWTKNKGLEAIKHYQSDK